MRPARTTLRCSASAPPTCPPGTSSRRAASREADASRFARAGRSLWPSTCLRRSPGVLPRGRCAGSDRRWRATSNRIVRRGVVKVTVIGDAGRPSMARAGTRPRAQWKKVPSNSPRWVEHAWVTIASRAGCPYRKVDCIVSVSSTALITGWRWAVVQPKASLQRGAPPSVSA